MIFTVSTVKDTLPNLREFCRRNLSAGADHMLLFCDGDAMRSTAAALADDPHVTCVVTDEAYWTPSRPKSLNVRQLVNANLANALLAGFERAHWLFHIDSDEVLQIDRDRLEAEVGAEVPVVRIAPLEAVSQLEWPGEVTHFKPLLDRASIDRLVSAGLLDPPDEGEPHNATWFSGHVMGKVGVRPNIGAQLHLHRALQYADADQAESPVELPAFGASWLAHRHYESHSGEEFVRKWSAHLDAGPIRLRPRRRRLMDQVATIVEDVRLDPDARREALLDLYRREVEDDLPSLNSLGVLVQPGEVTYAPRQLPADDRARLEQLLLLLVAEDKSAFNPRADARPAELMRALRDRTQPGDPLEPVLDRALAEALHAAPSGRKGVRRWLRRSSGDVG